LLPCLGYGLASAGDAELAMEAVDARVGSCLTALFAA
jgi:hypothetical protein